ncbi:tetratricopeptide repeat protein 39B isoform X1 [Apis mellifera caucasica]|uniref:Tetratricopeptide repeat protein 39B isoform X1 n=2 Tax=Apis mellifera TaxID=7460 RepID=A0A7M7M1H8_APIME|nr:tetratricopeptide repeat protein 39B isoform X1 [Apis mellifera]XP_016773551.1 tetratricopeptide repeat protein 39B isoform X1 [Apis mellifera]XP_016773552.1 tetratricopeptide repeat protein 39B isoform X1 [Apis mellifera]XP_397226.2 tetratricopeptide repeat protein 39B isoform X1 [Apis mellifera]KAG6803554.1 tetratricopeptide repeat protein 39B isoform X1 [Apis mellifera caucasica]KAG9435501.1 tetratricopeptide repeat protein 39B isoform X1 [Apis mellifera carnica]|eukprot:XP_016773550.1 tetratricopeptide repeat protein 39B isoform X1 [Apis mellifera]
MSDIEEDEFQDAQESLPQPTSMDLDTAIMEAKKAIHYFFNNDFEEARKIMEPWASSSMYHSLGTSIFAFLEAILTFEQKYIEKAAGAVKQCMTVCLKQRKHVTLTQNIGKMVKKTNYDAYTIDEVHAELCYAESLFLKSMLTFVEDETLVSFVKAGLKIRTCFLSYKECLTILNNRKWENDAYKVHFESGVRTGIGAFNLMISLLPAKIIKLLEFIGFSGDKEYGLSELEAGYQERRGLRHVLCAMFLLSYNLLVSFVLSHTDGDLDWCEKVLEEELSLYPNGVWFLFFKGRLELTRGKFENSLEWYTKSWKSQDLWPQFHHICFWELMWAHCSLQQWNQAAMFAGHLAEESHWSRTIYLYQRAAILMMQNPSVQSEEKQTIDTLMMQAPTFKQRIAGKSLPMEKFVIKKTERYFAQKKSLVLPIFELMYVWNLFRIVGKRQDLMLNMFKVIEEAEKKLVKTSKTEFHADNEALLSLLKGACLRQLKHPLSAENCLKRVLELDKLIKEDTYLLPYATVELALLAQDQGNIQLALGYLEDAKKNFTGYLLESRLQFRIHSDLMKLTGKKAEDILM